MSARVTYLITGIDADGVIVGYVDYRGVCMPTIQDSLEIAMDELGIDVTATECERSSAAKLGVLTAACKSSHHQLGSRGKVLRHHWA